MARYGSYSSDESDDHHTLLAESLLDKKKREIVARSMAVFNKWLDKNLGKRVRDDQESSDDEFEPRARKTASKKQRRHTAKTPEADDDSDHQSASSGGRLACPYFKHNHAKYKAVKTCMGPGWDSAHRVKEHLYRNHALPKYSCPRCFEAFKDDAKLKSHQRSEKGCKLKTENVPDGFDQELEGRLRARAKSKSSEEEKWAAMFEILFPGATVPSPYYEHVSKPTIESVSQEMNTIQNSEELTGFLRRELPKIAQTMIEREVERQFKTLSDNMLAKTVEICDSIQNQLIRTWMYQKEQSRSVAADQSPGSRTPRSPGVNNEASPEAFEFPPVDAFQYPILLNMEDNFPFEAFMNPDSASLCGVSTNTAHDSAYYSSADSFPTGIGATGLRH